MLERRLDALLTLSEGIDGVGNSSLGRQTVADMFSETAKIETDVTAVAVAVRDCRELPRLLNAQAHDRAQMMILAKIPVV